jgi:hypothetical protein
MGVSDASYYMNEKGNKSSQMGHTKKLFNNNFELANQGFLLILSQNVKTSTC